MAIAVVVLLTAGSAGAARPAKGGRYVGFHGAVNETSVDSLLPIDARARVSRSRRRFRKGSYIKYAFDCRRDRSGEVGGRIRLGSRLRIRRNGSFRLAKRRGKVRYRLRGRFLTRDTARVLYRVRRPPRRPRNRSRPGRCSSGRQLVALYRNGQPPFSGCQNQRAPDELRTGTARVFRQYRQAFDDSFAPAVFACLFATNRRYLLGHDWDQEHVDLVRLSGPYGAYAVGQRAGEIIILDLRTGRALRTISPLGTGGPNDLYPRSADDLVLKENGSVAWIASVPAPPGQPLEVWAFDSQGKRRLDSGTGIQPTSLTLDGSLLRWTHGGGVRSATLF